jgi:hypothetical protein
MTRRLLYKLTPMSEDERLIGIFRLGLHSINQSSEYDLLVVLVNFSVLVGLKHAQSCHFQLQEICLSVCGPFQDMTELIECILLDIGAGELLPAASEVRHWW